MQEKGLEEREQPGESRQLQLLDGLAGRKLALGMLC